MINDEIGQKLEFKYISLVFQRGQAEFRVADLTEMLAGAVEKCNRLKAEEDKARDEVNNYYGKQMLI